MSNITIKSIIKWNLFKIRTRGKPWIRCTAQRPRHARLNKSFHGMINVDRTRKRVRGTAGLMTSPSETRRHKWFQHLLFRFAAMKSGNFEHLGTSRGLERFCCGEYRRKLFAPPLFTASVDASVSYASWRPWRCSSRQRLFIEPTIRSRRIC